MQPQSSITPSESAPPFTDAFLDALGRWQRGWRRDRQARLPIAEALEREATMLPGRFRAACGPVYRKRHLYRTVDQRELNPLFLSGTLDEGSATSWSTNRSLIAKFGDDASFGHPDVAAGAIFRHMPTAGEVVLNIGALWTDPDFVAATDGYALRGGREAIAICKIGARQAEIVLRAPLRLDEIVTLSRPGDFDSLAETASAITDEERADLANSLMVAGIRLENPVELSSAATARVLNAVIIKIRRRMGSSTPNSSTQAPSGNDGS